VIRPSASPRVLIGLALSSILAGCASAPAAPALEVFAPLECAQSPELAGAISLVPEKEKKVWVVDHAINAASPCLEWEGAKGPYAIFALPSGTPSGPIEIGAALEAQRVFSPHVVMLDAAGAPVRSFTPEQYHVRSDTYSVQFLPQGKERYMLVTANPARIGTAYEGIRTGTSNTYIYTGYAAMSWTSGTETSLSSRFSYDGVIRAKVFRSEAEGKD